MRNSILLFAVLLCAVSARASEIFIRVNAPIEFYASVQNQTIYNTKNVFKFYDVQMGNTTLLVLNRQTNAILLNTVLAIGSSERIVIEVSATGQTSIIQRIPIQEINWYTSFELNANGNMGGGIYNPNIPNVNGTNQWGNQSTVHPTYFQQFLQSLQRETMDSGKLKSAKNFISKNRLTAEQIAQILKKFSFDANRLDFAKYAYQYCVDQNYYFQLKESFDFSSNYNSLMKHIESK